ncbi:MAG: PAS domain-containing protein [Candidatus Cloacimonetes bacterium]|nr:PAS domain-containing protein [Candidatus Cloacimonadota bacterium]
MAEFYQEVLEGINTPVLVLHYDGQIKDLTLLYANRAALTTLNLGLTPCMEHHISTLLPWIYEYLKWSELEIGDTRTLTETIGDYPFWVYVHKHNKTDFIVELSRAMLSEPEIDTTQASNPQLTKAFSQAILKAINKEVYFLKENQYLKSLLDLLPTMAAIKDSSLRYRYVNKAFCEFVGKTHDELLGLTDADFCPMDQAHQFQAIDRMVIQENRVIENEELYTDTKGVHHHLLTKKTPIMDNQGNLGVQFVTVDITEVKSTHKKLEELMGIYQDVSSKVEAVFWMVDTQFRISFVSQSIRDYLGYDVDEFSRLTPWEYFSRESLETARSMKDKLMGFHACEHYDELMKPQTMLINLLHKAGHYVSSEFRFSVMLNEEGQISGYQGFIFRACAQASIHH